ncbi:uncharacterized protein TNCV_3132521 [Trichonephila clavipes]|nr:uncharacterized protein TNCV_3132521 [Trichonephila clavipes]
MTNIATYARKAIANHRNMYVRTTKVPRGTWRLLEPTVYLRDQIIQNYYGIAIRNNVGNLQKMMSSVIAAFFHCVSGKTPLHGQCPEGSESWCRYQRAKQLGVPSKKLSKDFLIKL